MTQISLSRRLAAEALGTALLLIAIVGSGMMGQRLIRDSDLVGVILLVNAGGTALGLYALIRALSSVSSHFNPVVSLCELLDRKLSLPEWVVYCIVQTVGAMLGVAAAQWLFEIPDGPYIRPRTGVHQWTSEILATFGLVFVVLSVARTRPSAVAGAVASYVGAAMWFTPSTCFSNPAVTLGRTLTGSFCGIRWSDAGPFIGAQVAGAFLAYVVYVWLFADHGPADERYE